MPDTSCSSTPANKLTFQCFYTHSTGEGNGTPLQYFCLENPMGRGAWQAAVHGIAKSRTRLSDFPFTFHFHALEKEMEILSSVLAWRIPGTGEPGGCRLWHHTESDTTEVTQQQHTHSTHRSIRQTLIGLFSSCIYSDQISSTQKAKNHIVHCHGREFLRRWLDKADKWINKLFPHMEYKLLTYSVRYTLHCSPKWGVLQYILTLTPHVRRLQRLRARFSSDCPYQSR